VAEVGLRWWRHDVAPSRTEDLDAKDHEVPICQTNNRRVTSCHAIGNACREDDARRCASGEGNARKIDAANYITDYGWSFSREARAASGG
jgi:hypothetical protein